MQREIHREAVRALVTEGVQLVEVLPASAYDQQHIAGAISIPLTQMDEEAVARLDRNRPVVVYCYDYQ